MNFSKYNIFKIIQKYISKQLTHVQKWVNISMVHLRRKINVSRVRKNIEDNGQVVLFQFGIPDFPMDHSVLVLL